jgi:hypothetical protein
MSDQLRVAQHAIPRHVLARFSNDDGRLTVVRRTPVIKVLRNQAPENVGVHNHLNNWRDESGQWNDELETGPLGRLDGAGGSLFQDVGQFGIEADAEAHPRLLNWDLEQRAALQLCIAGMMVRTTTFREGVDRSALPALLKDMSSRLEDQHARGAIGATEYELLRRSFATTGRVKIVRPPYWHLRILVPLIQSVATQLHLDTLVAVRRFSEPLLLTGAEPVVLYPTANYAGGVSLGELLGSSENPIQPWRDQDRVLQQINDRIHALAGLAVAVDPHTLLLMFNPDTDDGGKLAWQASRVRPEGIAGALNIMVGKNSSWLAGRDDSRLLALIADSMDRDAQ